MTFAATEFCPEHWIREYVPGASMLTSSTLQPILFFTLLWNLFETVACGRMASPKSITEDVEQAIANGKIYLHEFHPFLNFFQHRYCGMTEVDLHNALLSSVVKNQRDEKCITRLHRVLFHGENSAIEVVFCLLFICYRIRNNLFHGEKAIGSLHKQIDLFKNVNALVALYLSHAHPKIV